MVSACYMHGERDQRVGVKVMVGGLTLQERVSGLQSSCAEISATLIYLTGVCALTHRCVSYTGIVVIFELMRALPWHPLARSGCHRMSLLVKTWSKRVLALMGCLHQCIGQLERTPVPQLAAW